MVKCKERRKPWKFCENCRLELSANILERKQEVLFGHHQEPFHAKNTKADIWYRKKWRNTFLVKQLEVFYKNILLDILDGWLQIICRNYTTSYGRICFRIISIYACETYPKSKSSFPDGVLQVSCSPSQMIQISTMKVCIFCKEAEAALQEMYTFTGNLLSKLSK